MEIAVAAGDVLEGAAANAIRRGTEVQFETLGKFVNQGQFGNRHLESMIRYRKLLSDQGLDVPVPKGIVLESTP